MPTPKPQNSLISAITDQPLLLSQGSETMFSAYLQELASDEQFMECYDASVSAARADDDDYWDDSDPRVAAFRPYNVQNGVLTIPVQGVLLNKFSFQFGRRATGYQYIERAVARGLADDDVRAIAFDINSPGGEVAGNFELVEKIAASRDEKPMRSFANDHAHSAGYSIASAASQIIMARSGGVGSVGVVVAHVEMSEMLKDWGIKVTFIHAGKHKVDGNPYEKLSESAKQRLQARVDRIYGEFVALVAENRGMAEADVRDTEALTYDSSEAIQVGFADRIGVISEEMAVFAEEADNQENRFMTTKAQNNTPAPTGESQITQAQHDAAVATATTEGATAERARINAILDSDEGKARPRAALGAALKTDLSVEQATAFLATLPEEKAAEPAPAPQQAEAPAPAPAAQPAQPNGFNEAMNASGNPNVGADGGNADANSPEAIADQMAAAYGMASGRAPGQKKQAA